LAGIPVPSWVFVHVPFFENVANSFASPNFVYYVFYISFSPLML
jgi:hypothetical protein